MNFESHNKQSDLSVKSILNNPNEFFQHKFQCNYFKEFNFLDAKLIN